MYTGSDTATNYYYYSNNTSEVLIMKVCVFVSEASSAVSAAAAADCKVSRSDVEQEQCSRTVFLRRDEDGDLYVL